jgi:hypothetical protein
MKFGTGAKLSSTVAGLPPNSCVRGNTGFACLVTSLDPGASVTLTFTGVQTVSSTFDIAAAQAFMGGLFTTSSVSTSAVAAAPASGGGGGGTGGGGTGGGGTGGGGGAGL